MSSPSRVRIAKRLSLPTLLACLSLSAQEKPPSSSSQAGDSATNSTETLQKATQNPVADLSSVPPQNNSNFGIGQYDRTQPPLPTPGASITVGRSQPGSHWYRDRTQAAENPHCSGSANAGTRTCARC
jgi:hypothetical protein